MRNYSRSFNCDSSLRAKLGGTVLIALVALSGCALDKKSAEYGDVHRNQVRQELRTMTIDPAVGNSNLVAFVDDYLTRGSGALMVNLSSDGKGSASAKDKTETITNLLLKAGLRKSEVIFLHNAKDSDKSDGVKISYQANLVKSPDCRNWSSKTAANWKNKFHSNFGCSYQRNIGQMMANPRDLETPRTMSDRPAPHSLHIVNVYDPAPGSPSGDRGIGATELRISGGSGSAEGAATAAETTTTESSGSGQ